MKIAIDVNEWWPVRIPVNPVNYLGFGGEVEIDKETVQRWQRVFTEFRDVQREMERLLSSVNPDGNWNGRLIVDLEKIDGSSLLA